jgi:membrane-associated protease RseP (regulator of RpoE activity)
MLDEHSLNQDYQAPKGEFLGIPPIAREYEDLVRQVMHIEARDYEFEAPFAARYVGQLSLDSAAAFQLLDATLQPRNAMALMSVVQGGDYAGQHQIVIVRERPSMKSRSWVINALLFILTVFSMMFAGALIGGEVETMDELWAGGILTGWVYAACLMLILGSHELGHYFAARYHQVKVSLPYFIPLPIGLFGTLGAFILEQELPRNRRQIFDVGIAGPLAGLVFAFPILFIGVATAQVNALPTEADCAEDESQCSYIMEGNSAFYAAVKYVFHGEWLPTDLKDMTLNQMAFAGWTGLFATSLNLIPLGQTDGGRVLYSVFGPRVQFLYYPLLGLILLLTLNNSGWILLLLLFMVFGRRYSVPMDDITPLDPARRYLGYATFVIFLLIFVPAPVNFIVLGNN